MDLTERKKEILRVIVEEYVETAEPVSSKSIADQLHVSSATIRNEMADLTGMGLLEQPHTSAGRIPSPRGYRIYVNELMEEHRLSLQETERINDALHLKMREMDRVLAEAGKVLSKLTNYPTFALAASGERVKIQRYELVMVDRSAFIVIVMTNNDQVRNRLIRLPREMDTTQLQLLNTLLNSTFTGLTLEELTPELLRVGAHASGEAYDLISMAVSFAMEVLEELENRQVHTAGLSNLLTQPEYRSLDKAQPLMDYLSEENNAADLSVPEDNRVKILIGPENVNEAFKETSVVMASYDIGDGMRGVIGVVGPTRMDYAKLTARLTYFADSLTRLFGRPELGPKEDKKE